MVGELDKLQLCTLVTTFNVNMRVMTKFDSDTVWNYGCFSYIICLKQHSLILSLPKQQESEPFLILLNTCFSILHTWLYC